MRAIKQSLEQPKIDIFGAFVAKIRVLIYYKLSEQYRARCPVSEGSLVLSKLQTAKLNYKNDPLPTL